MSLAIPEKPKFETPKATNKTSASGHNPPRPLKNSFLKNEMDKFIWENASQLIIFSLGGDLRISLR